MTSLPKNTEIILNVQPNISRKATICIKADSSNKVKLSK